MMTFGLNKLVNLCENGNIDKARSKLPSEKKKKYQMQQIKDLKIDKQMVLVIKC